MALQLMVASFPSSTVMFEGGVCIIGGDATSHTHSVSFTTSDTNINEVIENNRVVYINQNIVTNRSCEIADKTF